MQTQDNFEVKTVIIDFIKKINGRLDYLWCSHYFFIGFKFAQVSYFRSATRLLWKKLRRGLEIHLLTLPGIITNPLISNVCAIGGWKDRDWKNSTLGRNCAKLKM